MDNPDNNENKMTDKVIAISDGNNNKFERIKYTERDERMGPVSIKQKF
jgi:hypothetical protein